MTDPTFRGGCQCGAVRYALKPGTYPIYACHCCECQKQTASAFALSMPLDASDIDIDGTLATYERPTDSGTVTECAFCTACGTRVFHRSARSPERLTLKAGTLDDTGSVIPCAHLWTRSRQPWFELPSGVPAFDTQPDDLNAWRKLLSKC